jgi:hypothetical protein
MAGAWATPEQIGLGIFYVLGIAIAAVLACLMARWMVRWASSLIALDRSLCRSPLDCQHYGYSSGTVSVRNAGECGVRRPLIGGGNFRFGHCREASSQ